MTERVMMKCGCVAQGTCSASGGEKFDPPIPSCVIHNCLEVEDKKPDLTGRISKCNYRHKRIDENGIGYNYSARNGRDLSGDYKAEAPSSFDLPFFKHQPDKPHDEHYCGCFGWD